MKALTDTLLNYVDPDTSNKKDEKYIKTMMKSDKTLLEQRIEICFVFFFNIHM